MINGHLAYEHVVLKLMHTALWTLKADQQKRRIFFKLPWSSKLQDKVEEWHSEELSTRNMHCSF